MPRASLALSTVPLAEQLRLEPRAFRGTVQRRLGLALDVASQLDASDRCNGCKVPDCAWCNVRITCTIARWVAMLRFGMTGLCVFFSSARGLLG